MGLVATGWEQGEKWGFMWIYCLTSTESQFRMMKRVWRWVGVTGVRQCECKIKNVKMVNFMLHAFYHN